MRAPSERRQSDCIHQRIACQTHMSVGRCHILARLPAVQESGPLTNALFRSTLFMYSTLTSCVRGNHTHFRRKEAPVVQISGDNRQS